jgi:predicted nucleic acid-binding protein
LILVDTSVWVDHLRRGDAQLVDLLESNAVIMHPFVIGEIACGSLSDRAMTLELLHHLPSATVADADEVLGYIDRHRLHGKGIGYVDIHLLASTAISGAKLWTRDKRLRVVAQELGCALVDASNRKK